MTPDQQSEIARRLRCAAGHLNAVIEMTEAGQPCEQVLHQLNAVEAALRRAGTKLLVCEAQSSHAIIVDSPSREQRMSEVRRLQSLYTTFMQYSKNHSEVNHV